MKERTTKIAKETTHRDPVRRAERIERRAKKRVETAMRKKLVKMMKYGSAAGIPTEKQQFHALKHSIGTHILDAGEDVYFAKDWLGHKNIQNTIVYAQFSTATRDARARKMSSSNRVV